MRIITMPVIFIIAFTLLSACGNKKPSANENASISEEEENKVIVTVNGEEWSTTNVTLAGTHVFGMTADSKGTYGISVRLGYNLENTGPLTNRCEYTLSGRDREEMAWVDEECSIEVTAITADNIEGNFSFTGVNEESEKKSISGKFAVQRSEIR